MDPFDVWASISDPAFAKALIASDASDAAALRRRIFMFIFFVYMYVVERSES